MDNMEFDEGSNVTEIVIKALIAGGIAAFSFAAGYIGGKQSTETLAYLGLKMNPNVDIHDYYTEKQITRLERKVARGIKQKLKKKTEDDVLAKRGKNVKVPDNKN